jgi:hypothetical protein
MSQHVAFAVGLGELLGSFEKFKAAGIEALDFARRPTREPVVLAWMPAAAVYFHDPDGNLLEYVTTLPDVPRAELGVVPWSRWLEISRDEVRSRGLCLGSIEGGEPTFKLRSFDCASRRTKKRCGEKASGRCAQDDMLLNITQRAATGLLQGVHEAGDGTV